jgi:rod shape-determining protein MreD
MEWIRQIVRLVVVVLLQVLLFDHLQIAGWGLPMVYVLFLMNLPVQVPRWAEMLIGAMVGLVFDVWHSSLGVNMAACVAFCYLRPILLGNLIQDLERVKGEVCSASIGRVEYVKSLAILTVVHHFLVFSLESWSWHNWWIVLLQTLLSSVLTILIIMGYDIFKQ